MITHLISTTEFVKLVENKDGYFPHERYTLICNYANFNLLKPELWMFVPCNKEGMILEEPILENWICETHENYYYNIKLKEYKQAQSKVLFKGWKIAGKHNFTYIEDSTYHIVLDNSIYPTIESLRIELELTQTVLKQIGL